jgi:hypothetical protein
MRVGSGHYLGYVKPMFRFNESTCAIEDDERGLVVSQIPGAGHGSFSGSMRSNLWSFDFHVSRSSNQFPRRLSADDFKEPSKLESMKNPDYQVRLQITTFPFTGEWDHQETPSELAREAALAIETGFYQTDRSRIITN